MPLFGLTPVPDALDTPEWAGSRHCGPCYVMAANAERARLHAARCFAHPAAGMGSGGLSDSPWMLMRLVVVDLTFSLIDDMAPDGTIMVPDGAEDARGCFRVLTAPAAASA